MAAPLIVAKTDLLMNGPSMLIRYFAEAMGSSAPVNS
jgi:hypothetical protein